MKEKNKITIIKLSSPEHHGDWHDRPLKWSVVGPGTEIQKFASKSEAAKYRSCRERVQVSQIAIANFCARY
jgi:hypothetical protein